MVRTYEAVYENGAIRLAEDVQLPEHTRVYVVVPESNESLVYRVGSPRLLHPRQVADFVMEVSEESADALV